MCDPMLQAFAECLLDALDCGEGAKATMLGGTAPLLKMLTMYWGRQTGPQNTEWGKIGLGACREAAEPAGWEIGQATNDCNIRQRKQQQGWEQAGELEHCLREWCLFNIFLKLICTHDSC